MVWWVRIASRQRRSIYANVVSSSPDSTAAHQAIASSRRSAASSTSSVRCRAVDVWHAKIRRVRTALLPAGASHNVTHRRSFGTARVPRVEQPTTARGLHCNHQLGVDLVDIGHLEPS